MGFFQRYVWYRFVRQIKVATLLDLMPYVKNDVKRLLETELGWRDYGGKHHESVFTKFFKTYYLPTRFGFDKRRPHLSNLVLSGQMAREAALEEMKQPPCSPEDARELKQYVIKKLGLTPEEFEAIMTGPKSNPRDYASSQFLYSIKAKIFPRLRAFGVSS
jgi:hypothetical protein